MAAAFSITNPEELTQAAIALLEDKINIADINISDDFCIRIKIADDSWNDASKIDYKMASLVLDIQRDMIGLYNSISGENITLKNIHKYDKNFIVRVEINDGCLEAVAKIADFFKAAIGNMDSKSKVAAIALICATVAYGGKAWLTNSYLETVEKTKVKQMEMAPAVKAIEVLGNVSLALADNKSTPTHIASRISRGGSVEFGGGEKFTRQELKTVIKDGETEKQKLPEFSYTVDAKYDVPSYNYEGQTAKIRVHGFDFDASTKSLPENVKREIQRQTNEADLNGTFARINLQVVARVRGNDLIESFITGIGEQREGAIDILEALSRPATDEKNDKPVQTSFIDLLEHK